MMKCGRMLLLLLRLLSLAKAVDSDSDDLLYVDDPFLVDDAVALDDHVQYDDDFGRPPTSGPSVIFVCFSGEVRVNVWGRGNLALHQVRVGDQIQVAENSYQPVYSFAHRDETQPAEFIQIFTTESLQEIPLEMTPDHLLFVRGHLGPRAVPAGALRVGDLLLSNYDSDDTPLLAVTRLHTIHRQGIYAPLTPQGQFLVANGILVSNYVTLQTQLATTIPESSQLVLHNNLPTGLSHHFLAHWALTPYRMTCLAWGGCASPQQGMPLYVDWTLRIAKLFHYLPLLLQLIVLILFLALGAFFVAFETTIGPTGTFMVLCGVLPMGLVFYSLRRNNKR